MSFPFKSFAQDTKLFVYLQGKNLQLIGWLVIKLIFKLLQTDYSIQHTE